MSNEDQPKSNRSSDEPQRSIPVGGFLDGFANIIGKLGELAEKGEAIHREGNFESAGGKDVRGSYGFSIKMGADGKSSSSSPSVQPHKPAAAAPRRETAPAAREANVDVFAEGDELTIIAEMPGVPAENVRLDFDERKLRMTGDAARLKFQAEVELPIVCNPEDVAVTANNGLIEVRLKASPE